MERCSGTIISGKNNQATNRIDTVGSFNTKTMAKPGGTVFAPSRYRRRRVLSSFHPPIRLSVPPDRLYRFNSLRVFAIGLTPCSANFGVVHVTLKLFYDRLGPGLRDDVPALTLWGFRLSAWNWEGWWRVPRSWSLVKLAMLDNFLYFPRNFFMIGLDQVWGTT